MGTPNVVGYLLQETSTPSEPVIIEDTGRIIKFRAVLQDYGVNRNRRRYSKALLEKAHSSELVQELIRTRNMFGEANHPFTKEAQRQMQVDFTRTSHINTSFNFSENNITGIVETTGENQGPAMRSAIVDNKALIAFSMRGVGDVQEKNGVLDVTTLMLRAYDWVTFPSHKTAYMENYSNIITENSHIAGISKEALTEMSNHLTEHSVHVKKFIDQFCLENVDVTLVKNGTMALIESADGTRVVSSIEKDIRYDFRNFMSSLR